MSTNRHKTRISSDTQIIGSLNQDAAASKPKNRDCNGMVKWGWSYASSALTWAYHKMPSLITGHLTANCARVMGNPFYGRAAQLADPGFTEEILHLGEIAKRDPRGLCYFWLGTKPAIFMLDPSQALLFNSDKIERSPTLVSFSKIYGEHNVFVHKTDNGWQEKREILEEALFDTKALKGLAGPMQKVIDTHMNDLDKHQIFELRQLFTELAMAVIEETQLKVKSDSASTQKLSQVFDQVFKQITCLKSEIYIRLQALLGKKYKLEVDIVREQLHKVVKEHLFSKENSASVLSSDNLLNRLSSLEEKGNKTNSLIINSEAFLSDAAFILLAGHETTSRLLQFTIMLLAKHPEVLEKVRKEIEENFPSDNKDDKWTFEDLKKLSYLEMVMKESLRLYPPVPVLPRGVTKEFPIASIGKVRTAQEYESAMATRDKKLDITLYPGDKTGMLLFTSPYVTHRLESEFKAAEKFIPERFANNFNPRAYMPFGMGGRSCPGRRFSMQEAMLSIIKIVTEYNFKMDEKVTYPFKVSILGTLRCTEPVNMEFTRREKLDSKLSLKK